MENIRWKSPEYFEEDYIGFEEEMDVWSFGMTIYVRLFPQTSEWSAQAYIVEGAMDGKFTIFSSHRR